MAMTHFLFGASVLAYVFLTYAIITVIVGGLKPVKNVDRAAVRVVHWLVFTIMALALDNIGAAGVAVAVSILYLIKAIKSHGHSESSSLV